MRRLMRSARGFPCATSRISSSREVRHPKTRHPAQRAVKLGIRTGSMSGLQTKRPSAFGSFRDLIRRDAQGDGLF